MKNLIELVEIVSDDFTRAVKFYETVFDVKLTISNCSETEKMAFFPDTVCNPYLAISWSANFSPSKDGVLIHLSVENVESILELINANGGKTVKGKTKIEAEGMGYFALFSDSEGNTLGLYADR